MHDGELNPIFKKLVGLFIRYYQCLCKRAALSRVLSCSPSGCAFQLNLFSPGDTPCSQYRDLEQEIKVLNMEIPLLMEEFRYRPTSRIFGAFAFTGLCWDFDLKMRSREEKQILFALIGRFFQNHFGDEDVSLEPMDILDFINLLWPSLEPRLSRLRFLGKKTFIGRSPFFQIDLLVDAKVGRPTIELSKGLKEILTGLPRTTWLDPATHSPEY